MNPIQHKYLLDSLLGQFETFVTPFWDPPINEWIGVENIGASDVRSEVQFHPNHTVDSLVTAIGGRGSFESLADNRLLKGYA